LRYLAPEEEEPPPAPPPPPAQVEVVDDDWVARYQERRRQAIDRIKDREAFSTGEVALVVRVAPRTVRKWVDAGRLGCYRVGRSEQRRIPREELLRFLKEHNLPIPGFLEAEQGSHGAD